MPEDFIGQGERLSVRLLAKIFPNANIAVQVPLKKLLKSEYVKEMGDRSLKETIDIVVYRPKPLVIRVQDDRHKTARFTIIDERQRSELENSDCDVVDVWKSECPCLFKERDLVKSNAELLNLLENYL